MTKNSFTVVSRRLLLAAAPVLLIGCANGSARWGDDASSLHPTQSRFALQYATDGLKQELLEIGLSQRFATYWAAYVSRDWASRYAMEEFQRPVEQSFYAAYHQAAWELLEMRIDAVDASQSPHRVRVKLHLRLRNPGRIDQERISVLDDVWTNSSEKWMHLNTDPMLNGLRSVN